MSKTHRAEKTYHAPQVAGDDTWTNNGWASWLHNTMEDLDREEYEPDNQQEPFTEEDAWAALAEDYAGLDALEAEKEVRQARKLTIGLNCLSEANNA